MSSERLSLLGWAFVIALIAHLFGWVFGYRLFGRLTRHVGFWHMFFLVAGVEIEIMMLAMIHEGQRRAELDRARRAAARLPGEEP